MIGLYLLSLRSYGCIPDESKNFGCIVDTKSLLYAPDLVLFIYFCFTAQKMKVCIGSGARRGC